MKYRAGHVGPFLDHFCYKLGMFCGDVIEFSTIFLDVLKFPRLAFEAHDFPVTISQSAVAGKQQVYWLLAGE